MTATLLKVVVCSNFSTLRRTEGESRSCSAFVLRCLSARTCVGTIFAFILSLLTPFYWSCWLVWRVEEETDPLYMLDCVEIDIDAAFARIANFEGFHIAF